MAESSFRVQVDAVFVSFRDTVHELFGAAEPDEPRSLTGITLTQDADDDAAAFDPLLQ